MRNEIRKKIFRKKAFIAAFMYICFGVYVRNRENSLNHRNLFYTVNGEYSGNNLLFGTCDGYNIYIGSEQELESYMKSDDNICVIDGSAKLNPCYKICDSYRITNEDEMYNILGLILEYSDMYPSRWYRSLDGLQIEWYVHNVCYKMNILIGRTGSVDLDMEDYFLYENSILKLIFGK